MKAFELIAHVRAEEREVIPHDLTAEGYLVLCGQAVQDAAQSIQLRAEVPGPAARELAKQALARLGAAAAEGIAALEREDPDRGRPGR